MATVLRELVSAWGLRAEDGQGEEHGALVWVSQAFAFQLGWPAVPFCLGLRGVPGQGTLSVKTKRDLTSQGEPVPLRADNPPCATFP